MSQRTALSIAAALTVFVLAVVAGLVGHLTTGAGVAPAAPGAAPTASSPLDPTLEAVLREREAAYQAALADAQARVQAANAQVAAANAQSATAGAAQAAPTPSPAAPAYAILAEQAGAIALGALPGASLVAAPELVSYGGTVAYEVRLDGGQVYVDAQSGAVLAASGGPAAAAVAQGGPISRDQAIQAALAYSGGGSVAEAELERERGLTVYEVRLSDGGEVYVDAATGQVVYARMAGQGEDSPEHDD